MHGCYRGLQSSPWISRPSHVARRCISVNSAINQSLRKAKAGSFPAAPRARARSPPIGSSKTKEWQRTPASNVNHKAPVAIPYTTASSEFLYGTSAVKAALQARRRTPYKLYIHDEANSLDSEENVTLRKLAIRNDVPVERIKGERIRLMDKMSEGRPHNGYVLEASPLPKLPVKGLGSMTQPSAVLHLEVGHQSREDAMNNRGQGEIACDAGNSRYPFVILLDDVRDTGNLGAIIRSAFLFGIDAIALTSHCAPISAATLKASAGAAELVPLLSVADPLSFLDKCKTRGWSIYAASPPSGNNGLARRVISSHELDDPLHHSPCLLIAGSEGEGVRDRLLKRSRHNITIDGQRMGHGGVDSLNVSVASALLMQAFLQPGRRKNSRDLNTSHREENNRMF